MSPLLLYNTLFTALCLWPLTGAGLASAAAADGVRSEHHIFHHSCALKKDEGPCKGMKDRFYFDTEAVRCEPFQYGGCQGNENNFESREECELMCLVKENKSPCDLQEETGPCRGLVPRYFFDSKSQECKPFFYGGCFGNANNFKTIKECQARCQSQTNSNHKDLNSPSKPAGEQTKPATGSITEHNEMPLNVSHVSLLKESQSAAQEAEFTPPDVCMSPVDRGHCDGSERRYVYSSRTGRCQMFRYSGCGGNRNNFINRRHCMKTCMKDHNQRRQIRIKARTSSNLLRSV